MGLCQSTAEVELTVKLIFKNKEQIYQIPAEVTSILNREQNRHRQLLQKMPKEQQGNIIGSPDDYVFIPANKVYYRGQWNDKTLPQGIGEAFFENGTVLRGWFKEGQAYGPYCLLVMKNYKYYEGDITNGHLKGRGKFVQEDQQGRPIYTYEGQWERSKPNGEGKETFINGDSYEGLFLNGLKSGKKNIYYFNERETYSRFQGSFLNGEFTEGKLIKRNNEIIQGKFYDNKIKNCTIQNDRYKFDGDLVDGKPFGNGMLLLFSQNQRYKVKLRNGYMYGERIQLNSEPDIRNQLDVKVDSIQVQIENRLYGMGDHQYKINHDSISQSNIKLSRQSRKQIEMETIGPIITSSDQKKSSKQQPNYNQTNLANSRSHQIDQSCNQSIAISET